MEYVELATQAKLDAFLKKNEPGKRAVLIGQAWFTVGAGAHVEARESSHVEAWESSHVVARGSSHVEARESSHVEARESSHVEARGSSHVVAWESSHVVARGSSHVVAWESSHVVAWESSHVVARGSSHVVAWESSHVVAWESSHVVAWESSHVVASLYVAVHRHGTSPVVLGGTVIQVRRPTTLVEWAAFYGTPITDGQVLLYKAVRDDYRSYHGLLYEPGKIAEAPDWDGGAKECGGGLHFSPHPAMALEFDREATRFVACPVALEDCRPPSEDDAYPAKLKARRICGPIVEVDRYGKPVAR